MTRPARLLIAAHGTASPAGAAATAHLTDAVAAALPAVSVSACFLDSIRGTVHPTLAESLDSEPGPAVVVPLLLSTGYHVQSDIPAVVSGRPGVSVTAHLGPDPLVVTALTDRLAAAACPAPASVALVGVGSSRPQARPELEAAGRALADRLHLPVHCTTVFEDVRALLTSLAATGPVSVATYLLAPGEFHDRVQSAAAGLAPVGAPLGDHPAIVRLVGRRYSDATGAEPPTGPGCPSGSVG